MLKNIFDLFFPTICYACKDVLRDHEEMICTFCRHHLPLADDHNNPKNAIYQKFYGKIPLIFATSLFIFHKKGPVQELIHHLKYRNKQDIGIELAFWFAPILLTLHQKQAFDYIIPTPLHPKKLRERGYNQLDTFGKQLSVLLEVPYEKNLLTRPVYTKTQTHKDREHRLRDIEKAFKITPNPEFENKHFLLIDDVITTGATLELCGRLLLNIPGATLSIATLAVTES